MLVQIVFWLVIAVLCYVYVGYPLAMAVISSLWRTKPCDRSGEPSVSVLIPAYNEADVIVEKLRNALALDYSSEKLEILVGSDCSSDATVELANSFADRGVKVFAFPRRRGKASVMNDLVAAASGDVLLLCDANVMFARDALRCLASRLLNSRVGAVTGDVRLKSEDCSFGVGEKLYYWLERGVQLGESRVGSLMGVDGGMYVLRKDLFVPLPADTILDDFVISMLVIKQGKRVIYDPTAIADENATPSARSEFRRRMRVSAGAVQSVLRGNFPPLWRPIELWQYCSHKLLRWCVPMLLAALLALNACLLWEGVMYQAILAVQLLGYLLATAGVVSVQIRRTRLVGIPFYFVMTFVAMSAGMCKALLFRQSGAWDKTERRANAS